MKEIINIGIGRAGINIFDEINSQLIYEHNISPSGELTVKFQNKPPPEIPSNLDLFFHELPTGKHIPRQIFADLDVDAINHVHTSANKNLYNKNNSVTSKESSAGLFTKAE